MNTVKKISKWTAIGLGGLLALLTATVLVRERRTFEAPLPAIAASTDPAVIARGRYLAYGPAHCVECHGSPAALKTRTPDSDIPLIGGYTFELPIGVIRAPNITPDPKTGIGGMSDAQIARSLRHGVGRTGQALAPFMPFSDVSDEDLSAIISFLRAQKPVANAVETRALNPLGRAVVAFVLAPTGPSGPVPRAVPAAATVEYGRYLVHNVANCAGCHTQRNMMTGAFVGPMLAGGMEMPAEHDAKVTLVSPNLTPHPTTGRISNWTEEIFVARFRTGKGAEGTAMPWGAYARMSDADRAAIYRYLRSVPAVDNNTGESVRVAVSSR